MGSRGSAGSLLQGDNHDDSGGPRRPINRIITTGCYALGRKYLTAYRQRIPGQRIIKTQITHTR